MKPRSNAGRLIDFSRAGPVYFHPAEAAAVASARASARGRSAQFREDDHEASALLTTEEATRNLEIESGYLPEEFASCILFFGHSAPSACIILSRGRHSKLNMKLAPWHALVRVGGGEKQRETRQFRNGATNDRRTTRVLISSVPRRSLPCIAQEATVCAHLSHALASACCNLNT